MFSCCLFVYLWYVWLLLKKWCLPWKCAHILPCFQPFEGFDPEVKWILVLCDRCLVLVPIYLRCWRWVFCHKRTTFLPGTEMQTVSVRWLDSETRTSLGSTVDGSTWGGLSFRQLESDKDQSWERGGWLQLNGLSLRWLESETTRTSLESMVCGSTWGGLSLRRLECETTRTGLGSIKDGSSWWGLSLTFAPAWGSSTSSPAGHQSSTCGEQRWGRSEGSCRWCPVPVSTTRLLMLSGQNTKTAQHTLCPVHSLSRPNVQSVQKENNRKAHPSIITRKHTHW